MEEKFTEKISVILPVYNEERNIEICVSKVEDFLKRHFLSFSIIAVNDGSSDRTSEIIERLKKAYTELSVISHTKNRGYGSALISGLRSAETDLVFFMDADNQFDIREMKNFFPYLKEYDAIIGFREKRNDPALRSLNAWLWNRLVRNVLHLRIKDINCAFKVFNRRAMKFISPETLRSNSGSVNAEILYRLRENGARIKEVGVSHYQRKHGKQTGANFKVVARSLIQVFRIKKTFKKNS